MKNDLNRSQQDDIFDPSAARKVTIIGVGAVGSQLAVMLAKIGCGDITVWDGDYVESHNIPMSAYRPADLGRYKVAALQDIVREFSGVGTTVFDRKYAGERLRGSVVCCVDDMETRRMVWEAAHLNPVVDVFVDTRMAAELISVFAIDPNDREDIEYYERFLYPSSEAAMQTCGRHGIIYGSAAAACAACAALTGVWSRGMKKRHFQMLVGASEVIED